MFPKTGEVQSIMYFDEIRNKLFMTFNYQITTMSMKAENREKVFSHEKPVTAALYNSTYNQVSLQASPLPLCKVLRLLYWSGDEASAVDDSVRKVICKQ